MTKVLNLGNGFVQVDDFVVEKKTLDIIEKIRNYDPNLDVLYLNPDRFDKGLFDAPWVIIEHCRDGQMRKVFDVWEMNESVFERLIAADTDRSAVLANIDSFNAAVRKAEQARYREKTMENVDKFAHLLASPKTTYTVPDREGNVLTIDSHLGVTKRKDAD